MRIQFCFTLLNLTLQHTKIQFSWSNAQTRALEECKKIGAACNKSFFLILSSYQGKHQKNMAILIGLHTKIQVQSDKNLIKEL